MIFQNGLSTYSTTNRIVNVLSIQGTSDSMDNESPFTSEFVRSDSVSYPNEYAQYLQEIEDIENFERDRERNLELEAQYNEAQERQAEAEFEAREEEDNQEENSWDVPF